jgi:hypothetical protein
MLPKPLKHILPTPYLERREHPRRKRDKVIAVQLAKARRELLARPGPPKRITRKLLLGHIGYSNGFGETAGLHRALKALHDNMDSAEEFAIRRLKWNVQDIKRTGRQFRFSVLLTACNIRIANIESSSAIAHAVEHARRELSVGRRG